MFSRCYLKDLNKLSFILLLFLPLICFAQLNQPDSSIVLTEVMFDPIGSEFYDEFVEIFNLSPSDSIDLSGWTIGDSTSFDEIIDAGEGLIIPPGNFGLILDDGYFEKSNSYDHLIPENAVILTIDGATFGRNGWTNSESKPVVLKNAIGKTVDTYSYSVGNQSGHSDEKINLTAGNQINNWADSYVILGTPGSKNSVSPLQKDLQLSNPVISPNPAKYDEQVMIELVFHNSGSEPIEQFELYLFKDTNQDSMPQSQEIIFNEQLNQPISIGDSLQVSWDLPPLQSGFTVLSVLVSVEGDQNLNNNFKQETLKIGYQPMEIVVNEIMYKPLAGDPEWIELFNQSANKILLKDWSIIEVSSGKQHFVTSEFIYLDSGNFLVIASDSLNQNTHGALTIFPISFPSLNNDEEHIRIIDFSNTIIDEVFYTSDWGGDAGVSLERINPKLSSQDSSNWASSASLTGFSIGEENSVFVETLPDDATLSAAPNPFSPDGDGHEDVTIIQYNLPVTTAYVSLKVFDVLGREIADLLNSAPSGSHRDLIWDGRKNNGDSVKMGVYILYLEALNQKQGLVKSVKKTVVVAGRL